MSELDDNTEIEINGLLEQLKDNTTLMKKPISVDLPELKKEEAEQFVIKNAGNLIQSSLEMVNELKGNAIASCDPETIDAVAKLIAATSTALETLNKLVVQDKKSKTAKEIKQMDIDNKPELKPENQNPAGTITFKGTREEIFKQMIKEANVVEVDPA